MASLNFDFEYFKKTIEKIRAGGNHIRLEEIRNLLECDGFNCHFYNNDTNRGVYSIHEIFEYPHEQVTAFSLTTWNYDVVFMPDGFFARSQKRFDILLCRDHVMFEVDLKRITSSNPDTIGNRIKEGSDQASRLVIDIQSGIEVKALIEGLKSGCTKNDFIKEIMLIYKSRFYRLFKSEILSNRIFDLLK